MDAHPCQDGIHQLTLWQREVGVMIAGQDIAEQQHHQHLGQGGHAGAHDPHPPPGSSPGKVLPWHAQQLGNGLLVKPISPAPPLTKLALLALL